MKRKVGELKKDRIVSSGGQTPQRIDEELDKLIEENIRLQEEDQKLTKAVQKLSAKRKSELLEHSAHKKNLTVSYDKHKRKVSKSRSPSKVITNDI